MKKILVLLALLALGVTVAVAQDTSKAGVEKAAAAKVDSVKAAASEKADTAKATAATKADTAKAAGVTKAKGMMDKKRATEKKVAAKTETWITTKSGLKYRDIKVGTGDEVTMGSTPSVDYTGWLWVNGAKGSQFDSSKGKRPYPVANVGHGQVIAGWNEGLIGMKTGGIRELLIPPALGYGEGGFGTVIPPNSTLLFEVEIASVTK